ncbi:hypothetical protein LTR36_002572 [Oleoguttula mirabilis]|uniref:Heterokaryon incompatibility domain-containing protein n=1 Tax=Oleoguttula mirabilis TaxID=1507867 RepID=A0AAV9JK24_9PEZI|nr:hypothetical protein LTR36_002572 [Oleoguttula mirabilis]
MAINNIADSIYYKVRLQGDQIRVLVLEPTDEDLDDAFIQCRLIATSTDAPVAYEALSYTWGDDTLSPTRCIDCDGEVVPVTVNLYEALLAMRYSHKPRTLWVDALCIDQSNNEERNLQVSLMARIYRKAIGVLIWLGNDGAAEDGRRSLEHLVGLYDLVCKEANAQRRGGSPVLEMHSVVSSSSAPQAHASVDFALDLFLRRPWFTRRWVLQEVYQAREANVHCGEYSMRWEELVVEFLRLYSLDRRYRLPLPVFNVPHASRSLILDHLDIFGDYECHDPRDRIFSLLSLDERNSFRPNYALTTREAFTGFAQHSVMEGFGAQIIAHVGSHTAMPTWVPDWRLVVRDPSMLDMDLSSLSFSTQWKEALVLNETKDMSEHGERQPSAQNVLQGEAPLEQQAVRLSECRAKLIVDAFVIGIVESLSPPFKLPATASRFGELDLGEMIVRSERPPARDSESLDGRLEATTTEPSGNLYKGHHCGSVEPGDTVCRIKGSGLIIALRPASDQVDVWHLIRWCDVKEIYVADESAVAPVRFCVA